MLVVRKGLLLGLCASVFCCLPSLVQAKDIQVHRQPVGGAANLSTVRIDGDVLFGFNDDKLTPKGKQLLDGMLKKNVMNGGTHQKITGHADHLGTSDYNHDLALRRAEAVKKHLLSRDANLHFIVESKGDRVPLVKCPNLPRQDLIKCLSPNRRIEIDPVNY